MTIQNNDTSNIIKIGENVTITGKIEGRNNSLVIGNSTHPSALTININGDNNRIFIEKPFYIKGLKILCGNHVKAHNVELSISENVSIEPNGLVYLYNSGNICRIGKIA